MNVAGIIAEYNPFHNGHQFHIEETRRKTKADMIVAVISGDFVQRGAPALLRKYDRARMALAGGVDISLELPITTALSSAEGFAFGGVSLLSRLGVVDTISCGCESAYADPALFSAVADVLSDEPAAYREGLSAYLKTGLSFPAARSQALSDYFSKEYPHSDLAGLCALLDAPNNLLAIEYKKAIRQRRTAPTLTLIKRQDEGYHSHAVGDSFASATAIRKSVSLAAIPQSIRHVVPSVVYDALLEAKHAGALLGEDDFSDVLFFALNAQRHALATFGTSNNELAARTERLLEQFDGWKQFALLLKSRNVTYTAVSRYLTHVLLGLTKDDFALAAQYDDVPYARVLGFRKEAAPLLAQMQERADFPLLVNPARDVHMLEDDRRHLFTLQTQASELYRHMMCARSGCPCKAELREPVIVR